MRQNISKILVIASVFFALTSPLINAQETPKTGTIYASGVDVLVEEPVDGDLYISASGNAQVKEKVNENLFATAKSITVEKQVAESAFVLANQVILKEEVKGNAFIASFNGDVQIEKEIRGDLFVYAGRVVIKGELRDDAQIMAKEIYVDADAEFRGDVKLFANVIKVNPEAKVKGGQIIVNGNELETLENFYDEELTADIELLPDNSSGGVDAIKSVLSGYGLILIFTVLLGSAIAVKKMFVYFPVKSQKIAENMNLSSTDILANFKVGIIAVVAMFLGTLVLAVVGILFAKIKLALFVGYFGVLFPVLSIVGLLIILANTVSKLFVGYKIGDLVISKIQPNLKSAFVKTITGNLIYMVVLLVLMAIPFVGKLLLMIVSMLIALWSFGAVVRVKYDLYKASK